MRSTRRLALGLAVAGVACVAIAADAAASPIPTAARLSPVTAANSKTPGFAAPNVLSSELREVSLAEGSVRLENGTTAVPFYGYDGNGPLLPLPAAPTVEASKTEPDKNTYLVFQRGLQGADPAYRYGTHFLFQGHEAGSPGNLTRINLDADGAHRVTLLATADTSGAALPSIDGSTWDPFSKRLLFSFEGGNRGGIWDATPEPPATVRNLQPFIGRGGFEGMQIDSDGTLWFVEDVGGATGTGANAAARRPNSFLYRFVPQDRTDFAKGGKIQALQVLDASGAPITFDAGLTPDQAAFTDQVRQLHTCGADLRTNWVTLATTDSTSALPGPDDNALAKALRATPFKRPENGQFRPGTDFRQFLFDETGDTNATSSANAAFGGWGTVQQLIQSRPSADSGRLHVFYTGDVAHTGFDNVAFFDRDHISFVEDAGDTLHTQRNALDSAFLFDVNRNYCGGPQPARWLAEGRDPSATLDSGLLGSAGFQNEGDNEITGLHVSDGDTGPGGLLGARDPHAFEDGWRVFFTQQHGDNHTWEVIPAAGSRGDD
ncbi:MAG TPA: phosphatase [Candidatus Dormibacteraeota bacterium]|nr:phosphatase [Candidatus Dormibacteraeota bacterium]